jgi:hypothetical protein
VGPYTGWVNEIYIKASTPRQEINESPTDRLSYYDQLSRESAAQRLRDLGVNADPNSESFLAMSDKESRVRAARRLHDLGYDVDWQTHSFLEMSDIESRIRASKQLIKWLQRDDRDKTWRSVSRPVKRDEVNVLVDFDPETAMPVPASKCMARSTKGFVVGKTSYRDIIGDTWVYTGANPDDVNDYKNWEPASK